MSQMRDDQPNAATVSETTCRRLTRGGAVCAIIVMTAACSAETRESGLAGTGGTAGSGGSAGSAGNGGTGASSAGGSGGSAGDGGTAGTGAAGTGGDGGSAGVGGAVGGSGGVGATGGVGGTAGSGGAGGSGGTAGTGGAGGSGGNPCGNVDPDCECNGTVVVPKDADNDNHGSKACAANPGDDCDDGDKNFVQNACGGCVKTLGGAPGDSCNECGVFQCSGMNALQCVSPNPAPKRCGNATTPETCVGGSWVASAQCTGTKPACYMGGCVVCAPGTFKCVAYSNGDTGIVRCDPNTLNWASSGNVDSCYIAASETCNAATGKCITTSALSPRDRHLRIPSNLGVDLRELDSGRPTQEVLDLATGLDFA